MLNSIDLYLGSFLILCGFSLSLLNLRRLVKERNALFPTVLLSENLLLTCIGVAFISRAVYKLNPVNVEMSDMEERTAEMLMHEEIECNFASIIMSYGPLIVSLVNSFLSLVIDNYMHYKMIADVKIEEEQSTVRSIGGNFRRNATGMINSIFLFWKKYFTFIAVATQWILPALVAASMYSMDIREKNIVMSEMRNLGDSCLALLDTSKENCSISTNMNETLQFRTNSPRINYLEMYENYPNTSGAKFDSIVSNVYKIVTSLQNDSHYADINVATVPLFRKSRGSNMDCMKICYTDNKKLLLFMFMVMIVSYFVPITISTVILTKIHMMDIKKQNIKTYVSRELLYNVLFWSPVMLDTFLSLTLCSYNMNGMKTTIFNVIANVYQVTKNFINTKYFKDNIVSPV